MRPIPGYWLNPLRIYEGNKANYPIMSPHFLTMNAHAFIFCRVGARPDGENMKTALKFSLAKDSVTSRASLRRDYFGSCCMVS